MDIFEKALAREVPLHYLTKNINTCECKLVFIKVGQRVEFQKLSNLNTVHVFHFSLIVEFHTN